MNTFPIFISVGTGTAWVVVHPTYLQYVIVQLDMFPISGILSELDMLLDTIRGGVYDKFRNSYGTSLDIYNRRGLCKYISKCGIMSLNIGFTLLITPREYDAYEEIYLGTISRRNIPIHHLVYIEMVLDEITYNIAIEHYIRSRSNTINIFIETTYERLIHLIHMRYIPCNITIVY